MPPREWTSPAAGDPGWEDHVESVLTPSAVGQKRAILYDRVSTVIQAKVGYSGGAEGFQIERCRAYADARGMRVVGTLTDVDTGAKWDIDGIMEALDRARRREYDVLVVSETSRFARNMAKKLVYEHELRQHGVTVCYTNLPDLATEQSTPEGRLTSNIMSSVYGAFDEYDRDKRTWTTKNGRHQKVKQGKVAGAGPAPYGYRYVTEWVELKKRDIPMGLEADPTTAPIVERIFRDALRTSARDIAVALTDEGITPPATYTPSAKRPRSGAWSDASIQRMLHNTVYRGEWRSCGYSVDVPAIVDASLWERVQARLVERRCRRRGRDVEHAARWTLRGLLTCGDCGGMLSTSGTTLTSAGAEMWPGRRMRRYICARSQPSLSRGKSWRPCGMPILVAADERTAVSGVRLAPMHGLEDLAWDELVRFVCTPGLFERMLTRYDDRHDDARSAWSERLRVIDTEVAKQDRLMRRAEEEKLKLDDDDPRYQIHVEAGLRASGTLKNLRAERGRFVAAGGPGMSDDARAQLIERVGVIRELFGAALAEAGRVAPPAFQREVYEALEFRAVVRPAGREQAGAYRVGRMTWVTIEPTLLLSSASGFTKLYLLKSTQGFALRAVERL